MSTMVQKQQKSNPNTHSTYVALATQIRKYENNSHHIDDEEVDGYAKWRDVRREQ